MSVVFVLPHVVIAAVLSLRPMVAPGVWRVAAGRVGRMFTREPVRAVVVAALVAAFGVGVWWVLQPAAVTPTGAPVDVTDDWSTFGGGPARRGAKPGDASAIPVTEQLRWSFHDPSILERRPFASSPAIASGRVLIGSDNFKLYCLHLDNGMQCWTFEAEWPIFSSPAVAEGRVYVGEGLHEHADCKLYCLDLADGRKLWEHQTASHTESSPTVVDGRVYFGAGSDGVYCTDAVTGKFLWHYGNPEAGPLGDPHVDCSPLVVAGKVYFGSGYGFQGVWCLDARNGELLWKQRMPAPVWGAPSFSDGKLYVGVGNGNFVESDATPYGEVRCLDPADGRTLWRFTEPTDGVITSVAVVDGKAVFGSRDGSVTALDAGSGRRLWRFDAGSPVLSTPAVAADQVLFGADDGRFRCLDLKDGKLLWSYDTTGDVFALVSNDERIQSSPAVFKGSAVFGAANGHVYCLRAGERVIVETPPDSRLMRGANSVTVGFIKAVARVAGIGWALVLAALSLKLILLPIDRPQRPRSVVLALALLQVPLTVVVTLVVRSTSVFSGESFLWMSDLAAPDALTLVAKLPILGTPMTLLGLVLVVSLWGYAVTLVPADARWDPGRQVGLVLASIGVGWLIDGWAAAAVLFVVAMLVLSVTQHVALGGRRTS